MTDLERFFRQLVRNLAAADPVHLRQPISVGDVFRSILPYRANRRMLQLDTSEEYELVLMRLCAGEGGFAHADPEEARTSFERELGSPNPDLAVLRRHEGALLTLAPEAVAAALTAVAQPTPARSEPTSSRAAAPAASEPALPRPEPVSELLDDLLEIDGPAATATPAAPTATPASPETSAPFASPVSPAPGPSPARPAPPTSPVHPATPAPPTPSARPARSTFPAPDAARAPAEASTGVLCAFCGGALPTDRPVNFCPHCGQSQTQGRCPECGGDIQRGWRHCVSCGAVVERADAFRRRAP